MGLLNFEPKTNRFIIGGIILFLISVIVFLGISVYSGNLTGDDIVNIINAIGGIFEKEPAKVILKQ